MLEQTYTLVAESCESHPQIKITFEHIRTDCLAQAMLTAGKAFRQVRVTANETGEIIYDLYVDSDWFYPALTYGQVIDRLCEICYGKV